MGSTADGRGRVVLIYATYPTLADAETAGAALVDDELAACVNILPGMLSIYRWQGQRHREQEVVMIAKTRAGLAERAVARLAAAHPYDNPALVVLPVEAGAAAFLDWIEAGTAGAAGDRT